MNPSGWLRRLWRREDHPDEPLLRVLFVCSGNICRSPTAEGVARAKLRLAGLADKVLVESAGTHGYHAGEAPDPRTQKTALCRGYDLSKQRARAIEPSDFQRFDLLLAMDRGHYENLLRSSPEVYRSKIHLFMRFARTHQVDEVPDPYYGGSRGFEFVLDLCEDAVDGLIEEWRGAMLD